MGKHTILGLILAGSLLADQKLAFKDLPVAVQNAAKAEIGVAQVVGAGKEIEKGQTLFEVETKVDGKSRDLTFDKTGKLLSVEQEVELTSLPAAARESIQRKAAGRTVKKVESVTEGEHISYEATLVGKNGRSSEIAVNVDGTTK